MGGAAGHLMHLYDDLDLSFRKFVQILSDASKGKLVGSEKVDGFNLYLSFCNGTAIGARNKSDMLTGGLDAKKMTAREFAGGEEVKNIFLKALSSFEKAIRNLPEDTQEKLFQNCTIYYNAELLGPLVKNVINYDKNVISIHRSNHKQLINGEIHPYDETSTAKYLDDIINKTEEKDTGSDFFLRRDAIVKLKGLSDKTDLQIAKARIDKLLSSSKLSDSNTIGDYLKFHLYSEIEKKLPEFSKEIKKNIINNVVSGEKLAIPTGLTKETRSRISLFRQEAKIIIKNVLLPLEEIITDFSIAMLEGLESAYIIDNKKEVARLRSEVAHAIKAIQTSGNKEAVDILIRQLKKLKSEERINTPVEGFVFTYGDKVYKFTGAFAPVNQLLGLFKYGRGKATVGDLKKLEEDEYKPKIIAAIPGGFKPPHAGHYALVEQFAKMSEVQKIYIFISPKERVGHTATNSKTITANMSKQLWELYTHNDPRFVIQITKATPIIAVYELVDSLKPGDTLLLGQSEKEENTPFARRFDGIQKHIDKHNLGVIVKPITTPVFAGKVSGTEVREIIARGDKKQFFSILPQHLSIKEKSQAWSMVNKQSIRETLYSMVNEVAQKKYDTQSVSHEPFQNLMRKLHPNWKKRLISHGGQKAGIAGSPYDIKPDIKRAKSAPPIGENLEEMSGMGVGSIEGVSNKKDKDEMISRKEFVEELRLREQIKKIIQEVNQKKQVAEIIQLQEEKELRKQIQKLLFEGVLFEETDVDPHESTGINVLEELLKKIIPVLETDYKTLTTSEEQRKSFRAHIINAIQNVLIPTRVTPSEVDTENQPESEAEALKEKSQAIIKGAASNTPQNLEEQEDIDIKIGDDADMAADPSEDITASDDQFIDIKDKKKKKEKDIFTIGNLDMTGRNLALRSFDKIEKNIIDSYSLLSDEEDKNLFYSYIIANIKLYADKWEDELKTMVSEPTNSEYEQGKEAQSSEEETPVEV